YRQAYAFAAAFSTAVLMPMGFEYGRSQPAEGPEARRFDLGPFIAGINRIKAALPALNVEGPQRRLSRPDDPLVVLLRESENGVERVLTLVNSEDREPREAAVEDLLGMAGLGYLGDRLALAEILPGGAEQPIAARLAVAPLDVRFLRVVLRP